MVASLGPEIIQVPPEMSDKIIAVPAPRSCGLRGQRGDGLWADGAPFASQKCR
jgi:hypothetical protein